MISVSAGIWMAICAFSGVMGVRLAAAPCDCVGWRCAPPPYRIRSPHQLALGCQDRTVSIAQSRISSGDWTFNAVRDVVLQQSLDLRLRAQRKGRDDDLDMRLDGPWTALAGDWQASWICPSG